LRWHKLASHRHHASDIDDQWLITGLKDCSLSLNDAFDARRLSGAGAVSICSAWRRAIIAAAPRMETEMKRTFALFAAALVLAGTLAASAAPSLAQSGWRSANGQSWYGPGEYDRRVNGSDASTPGHN
jgi:hypothetical protein